MRHYAKSKKITPKHKSLSVLVNCWHSWFFCFCS